MEEKKEYYRGLRTGIISASVVALSVFLLFIISNKIKNLGFDFGSSNGNESQIESIYGKGSADKLKLIQQYIDAYYIEDPDKEDVLVGMMKGMITSLEDPYSVYYTSEEYADLMTSTSGSYYGIGVSVNQNQETGVITIVKVFKTSPAREAGMKDGDILYAVEGKEVTGQDLNTVVAEIRGKKNTKVNVTVLRNGEKIDLSIERREVEMDTVEYKMLDNGVGYLYISEFDGVTTNQVENAIKDLLSQGMTSIVVDLRDNPGGRLDVVEDIMDMFLPKDKLLMYMEYKSGERKDSYSRTEGLIPDMPMTVLINQNSASASELFTGAIQSYERGTIVGVTSFGKGIVQSIFPLEDGTALKLTTAKYYLPNGENIHKEGIIPDVVVELPEGVRSCWDLSEEEDNQLQKAISLLTES